MRTLFTVLDIRSHLSSDICFRPCIPSHVFHLSSFLFICQSSTGIALLNEQGTQKFDDAMRLAFKVLRSRSCEPVLLVSHTLRHPIPTIRALGLRFARRGQGPLQVRPGPAAAARVRHGGDRRSGSGDFRKSGHGLRRAPFRGRIPETRAGAQGQVDLFQDVALCMSCMNEDSCLYSVRTCG